MSFLPWFWKRRASRKVTDFYGVRFGMKRAEAVEALLARARAEGGTPLTEVTDDGMTGDVYVRIKAPPWTYYVECGHDDRVQRRIGRYREPPAGRAESAAWVAARIAAYGRPVWIAILAPTGPEVDAVLEWRGDPRVTGDACSRVAVSLVSREGEWNVREDWDETRWIDRTNLTPIDAHQQRLRALQRAIAQLDSSDSTSGARSPFRASPGRPELVTQTARWVDERAAVLRRLEALLPGVEIADVFDSVAGAEGLVKAFQEGCIEGDGAFFVSPWESAGKPDPVPYRVLDRVRSIGLRSLQLTWRPGWEQHPETGEPLPTPPEEYVTWIEGPTAAHLLREELKRHGAPAARYRIVPASIVTVEGAAEEWLRVPPAGSSPRAMKYRALCGSMHPLRLVDTATGTSVYLNTAAGDSKTELLRYAHAYLAALLAEARVLP